MAAPADGPRKASPAVNGSSPRTSCRDTVDMKMVTAYAMLASAPANTGIVNLALRASDRSTSGHRTLFSTTTKAASASSDPENAISVVAETHPQPGARSKVKVNNPIPVLMSASPDTSIRERHQGQRQVEPEDPPPADGSGEQPADEWACRVPQSRYAIGQSDRAAGLAALVGVGQHADGHREDQGCADPLPPGRQSARPETAPAHRPPKPPRTTRRPSAASFVGHPGKGEVHREVVDLHAEQCHRDGRQGPPRPGLCSRRHRPTIRLPGGQLALI